VATFQSQSPNQNFSAFGPLEIGGAAVLICAEDDAIEIHNRLQIFGPLPTMGRLIVIPLPDVHVANKALFEINPTTKAPVTTRVFESLKAQIKVVPELRLIVLDPLQALCGGADLNLPQHGQFICSALNELAAESGASVIVSHHLRKGGDIQSPDQARDAIRGSGGLVDGVRMAAAIWPDNSDDSKKNCGRLGLDWERNRVCKLAVVKANFKADLRVKTLVRSESGLLVDRGFDLYSVTPSAIEVHEKLADEIESAARNGVPFTKSGQNGLFERRHELPAYFHDWSRQRMRDEIQSLLNNGTLDLFKIDSLSRSGKAWLGMAGGCLSSRQMVATVAGNEKKPATLGIQ
jgi:hypothetical protein